LSFRIPYTELHRGDRKQREEQSLLHNSVPLFLLLQLCDSFL
jgi:hypothetical protein